MSIEPLADCSPARGEVPIEAVVFDTYGTVCDFYHPMRAAIARFADSQGLSCDAGQLAIEWRTAYLFSTFGQAIEESEFLPLQTINRKNLVAVLEKHFDQQFNAAQIDALNKVWQELKPWPDTIAGLTAIKQRAIIAPLFNGNFSDMVRLAKHARLPWDIILGSSLSGYFKPHPDTYLKSVAALDLAPEQVCMVAAHQRDLAHAAGHGMQTAFVRRPLEFGGPVKPANPEPGEHYLGAAEIHLEGEWTFVAEDFIDLASQLFEDTVAETDPHFDTPDTQ